MKRDLWLVAFGLVAGLAAAGLVYLAVARPRGQAVLLSAPPTPAPIQVYVSGGVSRPGLYALPVDSRVQDAVQAAGGLLPKANSAALNLAARLKDGEQVTIPTLVPTSPPGSQEDAGATRFQVLPTAESQPVQSGKININTASLEELDILPGIGPVTAQKIIDYRQANGPFITLEAIMDVSGIGPATYARLENLITIGP
jgi:competence protein ComEA